MTQSLAAVVTTFERPLELQHVPLPELEPGALLVRVDAATLCGTDVHFWHGQIIDTDRLPYIPGHETAGTILDMHGPRTDVLGAPLNTGDRIIAAYPYCGHCFYCVVARQPNLCADGYRYGRERCDQPPYLLGGCAQHHYIPPHCDIIRVPEGVSSPLAASAACALRTVMHAFERLGALASHETVLVQGCGPVGLYALAVSRDRGAKRVLVIGAPAPRLAVAQDWGADATLDLDDYPEAPARREWVLEHTDGRGPDVVIQCANSQAIIEGLDLVRPGGRYVSIGATGGTLSIPAAALTIKNVTYSGILMAEGRHFYQALEFLASRKEFPFDRLLSGVYPLDRTGDALQAMAELREVKPVILPNG